MTYVFYQNMPALQQNIKKLLLNQRWRFNLLLILLSLLVFISLSNHDQKTSLPSQNEISTTSSALSANLPSPVPEKNEEQTIVSTKINAANIIINDASKNSQKLTTAIRAPYYPVTHVVDGDTIDVNIDGQISRIRLIGINTPEVVDPRKPVQCFGKEASDKAKELLTNQNVRLEADSSQDDKDKYGRLLRYVWREDGLFYNLEIIKLGFAYEYTYFLPYKYQTEFKAAQNYAKDNKLGLWANNTCDGRLITANEQTSNEGDQALGRLQKTASSSCLIKGNINTKGEKIYHLINCPYYKQTIIDEGTGEKWFCTETEAIDAGWRKAQNCF
jgi:micrococcal nuclease